jgi:hypothetical protein
MEYTAPADRAVYDNRGSSLVTLQRSDPAYRTLADGALAYVPDVWQKYMSIASPPGVVSEGTVFLHRLRTHGKERLVAVNIQNITTPRSFPALPLSIAVIEPAGLAGNQRFLQQDFTVRNYYLSTKTYATAVFSGQSDPLDTSHFTFEVLHDNQQTIVDGWLLDNDRVSIRERRLTPPLQPSPASSH